jgi:hypothetical protein
MPKFTVRFFTEADWAQTTIKVPTAKAALKRARAMERRGKTWVLDFQHYDSTSGIEQIEVANGAGEIVATAARSSPAPRRRHESASAALPNGWSVARVSRSSMIKADANASAACGAGSGTHRAPALTLLRAPRSSGTENSSALARKNRAVVHLLRCQGMLRTWGEHWPSSGVRPWGRTGSGCRIDRCAGVLLLELGGAEIADG